MNEKLYKAMNVSAISSLVIGICVLTTGIASGVLLIINGIVYMENLQSFSELIEIRYEILSQKK